MFLSLPNIFSSVTTTPIGECLAWRNGIVWTYAVAGTISGTVAVSLTASLLYVLHKRREITCKSLLAATATAACLLGLTQLSLVWTIFRPPHGFEAALHLFSALAALAAFALFWRRLPKLLQLLCPTTLDERNSLQDQLTVTREALDTLEREHCRLADTERIKDEFIAMVSREVRTPLTLILAPLEALLAQSGSASTITCERQMLLTMHRNSVRMHRLFNALLDASKAGLGQLTPRHEPTQLVAVTRAACDEYAQEAQKRSIKIFFTSSMGAELTALTDRYLYERIASNLISNAIKFSQSGDHILVNLQREGDHIRLIVSDSGPAIAQDTLPFLFQRLHKLEPETNQSANTSRVGLALVKEFAELLGGHVAVESSPDQGSTFTVELLAPIEKTLPEPAATVPLSSPDLDSPIAARDQPRLVRDTDPAHTLPRVLIVEDNYDLADFIASLMSNNYAVRVTQTSAEAEEVIAQWMPDLILADVMMPKMDGLTLCRKIKSTPDTSNIPFVLLTALTHREAVIQGWEAGADEYLFKPFHPEELLTRIKSLLRSIGTHKQAERELIEFNLRLEAEVKDRTKDLALANAALSREVARFQKTQAELKRAQSELNAAKDAAESANEAKSRFLANMSHEIRTPLGVVLGFSEMLIRNNLSEPERTQCVAAIQRNGELLSNVINDILDLSKVEAGKLETEVLDVSVNGLLADIQSLFAIKARTKDINFYITCDPALPAKIRTDPLRLRQILLNVIGNALKFTARGYIKVRVTPQSDAKGEPLISFEVEDSGCGISRDQAARLFDPFTQGDVSSTRRYGGTGLGLVLSRRLAQLLGGSVDLIGSNPQQGSIFQVTVATGLRSQQELDTHHPPPPQHAGPKSVAPPLPQAPQLRLDGISVLLVDDSPDNQILVSRMLHRAGATVEVARNGREGVDRTQQERYDVVLMDLQMPEMDGYEATSYLRRSGFKQPIIALTAHAMKEEKTRCLNLGFNDHISKPIDYPLLLSSVLRHVRPPAEVLH